MDNENMPGGGTGPVLCLSRDARLIAGLGPGLAEVGTPVITVDTLDGLSGVLGARRHPPPVLVLLDLCALGDHAAIARAAEAALRASDGPIPVVCVGAGAGLDARLGAMRAGIEHYLPPEIEPADLARRLMSIAGLGESAPPRVLVVDDQPVAALFAARVLEGAGMVAERIADPLAVLDAIVAFHPDLVLMDLHMPGASGIELTRIIREQEPFADLPIVFLSGELDPGRQLDALRVGADDFLAKPVTPPRLVEAVRRGLERARRRVARRLARRIGDAETGLAGREVLLSRLDHLIGTGAGAHSALVYLDCPANDPRLAVIAEAVRGCCRPSDLAARISEHGIAVLARGSEAQLGQLAAGLAEAVNAVPGGAADGRGAGAGGVAVGWCPLPAGGDESLTLVSRARKAAAASRRAGGAPRVYRAVEGQSRQASDPILSAIEHGVLRLLYQPMAALRGALGECYEVNPRLEVDDGDLIAPARYCPLAVQIGRMASVDRRVLECGLDALVACRDAGHSPELFLHQSIAGLARHGWASELRDGINQRDLIRLRPVIQLQVDELADQLELAGRRLQQLQHLGIHCCLNGLTPDPESLHVLATLPVAYVRLAARAVHGLAPEQIRALVARVHARGALAIVDGVDSPETIARISQARADLIQGPYIQPPTETMSFDPQDEGS